MPFDIDGARKAGYSDDEIADHLAKQSGFDLGGARQAGYSSADVIQHLAQAPAPLPASIQSDEPGKLSSLGAGIGQRFGNTVLGGQKLLGKGIRAAGESLNGHDLTSVVTGQPSSLIGKAGQWLINDAEEGQKHLAEQNAPYEAANPLTNAAGGLVSDLVVTAPVGGLVAKGVTSAASKAGVVSPLVQRLATAIESGGMRTGAAPALTAAEKATELGLRATGGAVNGAASTAVVSPEHVGTGLVAGGAFPLAVAGAGKVGKLVGGAITKSGGQRAATEEIAREIGRDNIGQTIGDIQTYYPKGAEDIPVSAAGVTQSPALARMEQASRLRRPAQWYDFDQTQGKAVYDNLIKATADAEDLGNRFANRAANWAKNWDSANSAIKPRIWVKRMGQLGGDIDQALMSPEASNPAVRRAVEELRDEVVRVGPSFSPAHLQQIRAQFNGKSVPTDPSAFKAAPRDNAAVRSLIAEMDDILNQTTGGRWDKVKQGYAQDSESVHAAKAAQQVRDKFVDQQTGRVRGVSLDPNGDVPKVTEAGLGRAMDAARLPGRDLALDPAAEQRLTATVDALRRQGIVQGVKRSSTAGGGSDTVSNGMSLGAKTLTGGSAIAQAVMALARAGSARKDAAVAELFANPDQLAQALTAITRPVAPSALGALPYRAAPLIASDPRAR